MSEPAFDTAEAGGGGDDYGDVAAALEGAAEVGQAAEDGYDEAVEAVEAEAFIADLVAEFSPAEEEVEDDPEASTPPDDAAVRFHLESVFNTLAPGLDPNAVHDRAEQLIDYVEEQTGLSGQELAFAAIEVAAASLRSGVPVPAETVPPNSDAFEVERIFQNEQAQAEWREAAATAQLADLHSTYAAGLDEAAVSARATELLEPLRQSKGAAGRDLVVAAYKLAAEDLRPVDDYDEAQARLVRRQEAGLPPVISGLGRFETAPSAVTPLDTDSYDDVVDHLTQRR